MKLGKARASVAPPLVGGADIAGGADGMPTPTECTRYKTWGKNRSVRLPGFDYAEHQPYHVILCAREGTRPFSNPALAADVRERLVNFLHEANAYLGAYCLLPDHLHVLMSPDRSGLSLGQLIGQFKGVTTNASWKLGWSGALWQARFYDHIVRKHEGIVTVARYIYENSDLAGLPPDYPFRFVDPLLT